MLLLDIPSDLALEIISVWLENELKCLSVMDIAFCSTAQRPAFLDLISDDRGGDATVLDRFKADNADPPLDDVVVPAMFMAYLLWLESREVPVRTLTVSKAGLAEVFSAAIVPSLRTVHSIHIPDLHWSIGSIADVSNGITRLVQRCPNVKALSFVLADPLDISVVHIFSNLPENIVIRLLSFAKPLGINNEFVCDSGVCLLAQCFGKTLTDLKLPRGSVLTDNAINMLAKFCKKLEVIELSCPNISMQALRNLLLSCKRLWSLTLHNFTGDDDSLLELLQVPNKLEVIKVFAAVETLGRLTTQAFVCILQAFPAASAVTINHHCSYSRTTKCPSYGTAVINCQAAQRALRQQHIQHEQAWAKVALWMEPSYIMMPLFIFSSRDDATNTNTSTNRTMSSILDALPSDIQEFAFHGRMELLPEHFKMLTTKFNSSLRMVSCDEEQYDVMAANAAEFVHTCPNLSHVCGLYLNEALRRAGIDRTVQRLGFECQECMEDV